MDHQVDLRVHGAGTSLSHEQMGAINQLAGERSADAVDVHGAPQAGAVRAVMGEDEFLVELDGTVSEL
jgi:hypothetical protein